MKGTLILFKPEAVTPEVSQLNAPPTLEELRGFIGGGYLEAVPLFKTIVHDNGVHHCVAFCDDEGKLKKLPVNYLASMMWEQSRMRANYSPVNDLLVGHVAVFIGDAEFMEAM